MVRQIEEASGDPLNRTAEIAFPSITDTLESGEAQPRSSHRDSKEPRHRSQRLPRPRAAPSTSQQLADAVRNLLGNTVGLAQDLQDDEFVPAFVAAADRLRAEPRIQILNDVVLNPVLVRVIPSTDDADAATRDVPTRVQDGRVCWLGGTGDLILCGVRA